MIEKFKKIYVFKHEEKYKIGTSHCVKRRLEQVSCGFPFSEVIYESNYLKNPYFVENQLHRVFQKYRIGGEWFSFVDLNLIDETIHKVGEYISEEEMCSIQKEYVHSVKENALRIEKKIFDFIGLSDEKHIEPSIENEEIEKFTKAIEGIDEPNIYSDLIYQIVLGGNTEGLIKKYKPKKFTSFRFYLSDEQNLKIKQLTEIAGALICNGWNYEEIEGFLNKIAA